jgi:transcriptional regulator with XRE-family HTH domain
VALKQYREKLGLTQKELSARSGINYRSLQDYEQGHKRLASATGDTLLKLSLALGCSVEQLLSAPAPLGAPLHKENDVDIKRISTQPLFCKKYQVPGKWVCDDGRLSIVFFYDGYLQSIPFNAIITEDRMPWVVAAAEIQIESAIDELLFQKQFENWEA